MDVTLRNHSDGTAATVTPQNQILTKSEVISQQHFISTEFGRSFQAEGVSVTLTSATHTVLHLKNDDPQRNMVISYIRTQLVGANASNLLTNYFELGFDRTVSANGTVVEPTNMNRGSGVAATFTATSGAGTTPTMAGTFVSFDKWYPKEGNDRLSYNKEGSIILGLNDTLEVRYVGTATAGNAYARATIMMVDK